MFVLNSSIAGKRWLTMRAGNIVLAVREYKNWPEVILSRLGGREVYEMVLKNGVRLRGDPGLRQLVNAIFFARVYNPTNFDIGADNVVLDIGANVGVFTLFAARKTRHAVYAFEPSPQTFETLTRNIAANNLRNIVPCNCAVSDKVAAATLLVTPNGGQQDLLYDLVAPERIKQYRGLVDVDYLSPGSDEGSRYVSVPTTTIPEIMDANHLERIDFLKIDCEGAEGAILRSTPPHYLKRISKISMEFHDYLSELNHADLARLLEEAGFVVHLNWDGKSPIGYLYALRCT
jgi:FkbM family methyltransferase